MRFAHSVVALKQGRIVEAETPWELLTPEAYLATPVFTLCGEDSISQDADEDPEASGSEGAVAESAVPASRTTDDARHALDAERKTGDWSVYRYYFASSGYPTILGFLLTMALWTFCTEFASRCTKSCLKLS